jgi:hypothetical protein
MKDCPKEILQLLIKIRKLGVNARKPSFKKGLSRAYAQAFSKLKVANPAVDSKKGIFLYFEASVAEAGFNEHHSEVG